MEMENGNSNTYEEIRKQRLEENKKRFQDLGILDISKSLSKLNSPEKKTKERIPKPKPESTTETIELRRSSRARNAVTSYSDDVGIELPPTRKRSRSSSWASYIARPLDEVKLASYEDRIRALRAAEEFQSNLQSGNPSFVKSMVRSHVYSCFWLGLPTQFCKDHLPKNDLDMILEDENGLTYDAKYLGKRTGLSGGWRGFALDKKLDDGDAVVFELVEPDRFKVYTFRISSLESKLTDAEDIVEKHESTKAKNASKECKKTDSRSAQTKRSKKAEEDKNDELSDTQEPEPRSRQTKKSKKAKEDKNDKLSGKQKPEPENRRMSEERSENVNSIQENGLIPAEQDEKGESARKTEVPSVDAKDKQVKCVIKPRKKPAPRLFRKKV